MSYHPNSGNPPGRGDNDFRNDSNDARRQGNFNNPPQQEQRGNNRGIYSQNSNRPSRSYVPRTVQEGENRGNLAGSAQYPNMPVAKKNLAHTKQTFAPRPNGWVFDKEKVGTKTELWTNHALVHLPKETIQLYSYAIEVKKNNKVLTKREEASPLFHDVIRRNRTEFPAPNDYIFNDVNYMWSATKLPNAEGCVGNRLGSVAYKFTNRVDFGQTIREDQDRQLLSSIIDAIATARVKFRCNKYIAFKRCLFMIQDVAETPDEVMDSPLTVSLPQGIDARLGVNIAIRVNLRAGITACFDVQHTVFSRTGFPLVRLLCELINKDPISDVEYETYWVPRLSDPDFVFPPHVFAEIDRIIKKMKLRYSVESGVVVNQDGSETVPSVLHYRERGMDFKYYAVTDRSSDQITFNDETGYQWTVYQYYLEYRKIRLRFPHLPCIQKKPTTRRPFIVFPMEFVTFSFDPKRFEGEMTTKLKEDFILYTSYNAQQRCFLFQKIVGQQRIADVPPVVDNNDSHMQRHGLSFDKEMLTVKATVLPAPTIVYGEGSKFEDKDSLGQWKAVTNEPIRKVLDGSIFVRNVDENAPKMKKRLLGSILHVGSPVNGRVDFRYDSSCYHNLMKAVESVGQPVAWENKEHGQAAIQAVHEFTQGVNLEVTILDFFQSLKSNIDQKYKENDDEVLIPFVLVVFEARCSTLKGIRRDFNNDYNLIKYLADNDTGIHTQGILLRNLSEIREHPAACKLTDMMVEKILAKVGTTHRKLDREGGHKSWTKFTDPNSPTLVLGVDVCHPSTQDRLTDDIRKLSVATVTGNIDLDCTEFRASSRLQDSGVENLIQFKHEVTARLNAFIYHTGKRPAHIVVYRDGICEGDFQRFLYEERLNIEECCVELDGDYKPTITYIVVSKRHHTRFFLKDDSQGHKEHGFNLLPGTLVEDVVTSADYYDFFLATQVGQKGANRPIHYYVLHDTWHPFVSFWPTITHALTYLFCRATNTVSLPAPVLYAHLAAKRAKECLDGAWTIARFKNMRLSVDNVHDVIQLTNEINTNAQLDGMVFC